LYVFVLDREPDFLTDIHVKLEILVDTQEPFNTSHHKIAFEYDEDTVSLVEDQNTLSTLDMSISNNSNSSAGNTFTAFEYECYEIEDGTPWYHGPKIKIPKLGGWGHFKPPSSVHVWWADTCVVWLHIFTVVGSAAHGEAAKHTKKLTFYADKISRWDVAQQIPGWLGSPGYQLNPHDIPDTKHCLL
jgi:hypothetical protein